LRSCNFVLLNFGIVRTYCCEGSGAGLLNEGVSAPLLDVFHACRPWVNRFYSINASVNFFANFKKYGRNGNKVMA
jgi:hypothetical protein